MDVYDPGTNTIYPTDRQRIAAWFLDTDYDGRTFCICQAFFPRQEQVEQAGASARWQGPDGAGRVRRPQRTTQPALSAAGPPWHRATVAHRRQGDRSARQRRPPRTDRGRDDVIDRIIIKNFKSLRKVDLSLGRLNLFIGTNASGKSNFLEALRILQGIGNGYNMGEILDGKPRSATKRGLGRHPRRQRKGRHRRNRGNRRGDHFRIRQTEGRAPAAVGLSDCFLASSSMGDARADPKWKLTSTSLPRCPSPGMKLVN